MRRPRELGARRESGGAPAYWPWIEALRPFAADAELMAAGLHSERLAPLARLLPEVEAFGHQWMKGAI